MKKSIVYLTVSFCICGGLFLNTATAKVYYTAPEKVFFSRANCHLPPVDLFQFGKVRNETITWDPVEFYTRTGNIYKWRFWGVITDSAHYQRGNLKHSDRDIEEFGIHSDVTHLDIASQALWFVKGTHQYKGPFRIQHKNTYHVRQRPYTTLPQSTATDCNFKVKQFLGIF